MILERRKYYSDVKGGLEAVGEITDEMDLEMLNMFEKSKFNPLKHLGYKLKEMGNGARGVMGSSGIRRISGMTGAKKFGQVGIRRFQR